MSKKFVNPADFILPLNINGMDGRVLNIKSLKHTKSEILIIYGLRSNLERWWGLASALKQYSNVTMVDLPGFGGMDSFYSIGLKPTIDNLADYIASFIKLRYKRKTLSILGIGFGFVLVTRMLQRNPDLIPKVKIVISLNGYAHKEDLKISSRKKITDSAESYLLSLPLMPRILREVLYNPVALNYKYDKVRNTKKKDLFLIRFMIDLERESDLKTRKFITRELLKLDNCTSQVNLPLWNVTLGDYTKLVNSKLAEQHLQVIYKKYKHLPSKLSKNVSFIMSDEKMGQKVLPSALRRELKRRTK